LSLLPPTMRMRSMPISRFLLCTKYRANRALMAKLPKFAAI
jgi:hypothetical protein